MSGSDLVVRDDPFNCILKGILRAMITIRTYDELNRYCQVFARGNYNFFVVVGGPGFAKSRTMRDSLDVHNDNYYLVKGTVTAYQLYRDLYFNRNKELLVIDDVDEFYSDKGLIRLLKCLCETEETKTLAWQTGNAQLDKEGIPRRYTIDMKVAIIANDFKRLDKNVGALMDRGQVFNFEPDAAEVHKRASTFADPEVLDFIEAQLPQLDRKLTLRDYVKAAENKRANLDWQRLLLADKELSDTDLIIKRLLGKNYPSEEARIADFKKETGKSRATYFNRKKILLGRTARKRA